MKVFLIPIRQRGGILSEPEIQSMFGNIEMIEGFSSRLLASLQQRVTRVVNRCRNWRVCNWEILFFVQLKGNQSPFACIGEVFLQYVPFMKVFNEYCKNYDRCAQLLGEVVSERQQHDRSLGML